MKAKLLALCLVTLSVGLINICPGICPKAHASAAKPAAAGNSFEKTEGYQKIDLRLREAWKNALAEGRGDGLLECILKTSSRVTSEYKTALNAAGFRARTAIGKIVTGSVKAKDVPAVANLDFVEAIELAVPMSLKKK
jgi:hypothetical protein